MSVFPSIKMRSSASTVSSIVTLEKPRNRTPTSLQSRIDELRETARKETGLSEAVRGCSELVPGLRASLSMAGERVIRHDAYTGTSNLNELAKLWLGLGRRCDAENAPLQVRLDQNELLPLFQRFYKQTGKEIKDSKVAWFFNGFRETTIGCTHCLGPPQYVLSGDEFESRASRALFVSDGLFKQYWGEAALEESTSSIRSSVGSSSMATPEQLRDAIARGVEKKTN